MPIQRTAERSSNQQITGFRLRESGVLRQPAAAPVFIAAGTGVGNTTAVNINWPTAAFGGNLQAGDLGILVVESSGADATTTPSGWTHITGSPIVDIADATGSKLNVLWKFASSYQEAQFSLADAGDHTVGRIFTFRGVRSDVAPGRASATDTKTVASGIVTWPAITTVAPNSLVICIASRPDDTASTTTFSAFSNANLTGLTEAGEYGNIAGDGGGFVLNYGTRAAIGNIGTSTGTMSVSVTNALITFALEPSLALPA